MCLDVAYSQLLVTGQCFAGVGLVTEPALRSQSAIGNEWMDEL
jgi:hypothetical protein